MSIKIIGHLTVEKRNGEGVVVQKIEKQNLIVNNGKELIAKLIGNVSSPNPASYIQIGTGTTAADVTQTGLTTYFAEDTTTNAYEASYKLKLDADWSSGTFSGQNITEAGVFDGAQAGVPIMLSRQVFSAINLTVSDSLTITWRITVS